MEERFTVVCSSEDAASMNIERHLLALERWQEVFSSFPSPITALYESPNTTFRIVEVDEPLVYLDRIDTILESIGVFSSALVFASKHSSESTGKLLSAHYTGNTSRAALGGRERELCTPATWLLKPILQSMRRYADGTEWQVSMEATHHGPTDVHTPLVFAEIGSSEEEWGDEWAGRAVAKSIMECTPVHATTVVGFGGSHYPKRQTHLILESALTFGHCFSSHVLSDLDDELVGQAFAKSRTTHAYIDRKNMNSDIRERIEGMLRTLGCTVLREHEFYTLSVLSERAYAQLLDSLRRMGDVSVVVGRGIGKRVKEPIPTMDDVWFALLPPEFVSYLAKRILSELKRTLERSGVGYVLDANGVPLPLLFAEDERELRDHIEQLIGTWVDALAHRFPLTREKDAVVVVERRLDPAKAEELGIIDSSHLRRLSRGESVEVRGKAIKPDIVYRDINIVLSTVFEIRKGEIP